MQARISVIVPVYQVERYLPQCVESLRNQTYENLEVILVDDGSPDNSGALCDEYAKEDPRIRVIHTKNQGGLLARETGLRISSGEYVMFVDSDDYLSADFIASLAAGEDFDISYGGCTVFYEDSGEQKEMPVIAGEKDLEKHFDFPLWKELVKNSHFGYMCMKLYRRKLLENKTFQPHFFRDDLMYNLTLLDEVERVYLSGNNGYFYRQHTASTLHSFQRDSVPPIQDTVRKMMVSAKKFSEGERRYIGNVLIKNYFVDVITRCVIHNSAFDGKRKKKELRGLFQDRTVAKYLKSYRDDNILLKCFTFCYRLHLPALYYFLIVRVFHA